MIVHSRPRLDGHRHATRALPAAWVEPTPFADELDVDFPSVSALVARIRDAFAGPLPSPQLVLAPSQSRTARIGAGAPASYFLITTCTGTVAGLLGAPSMVMVIVPTYTPGASPAGFTSI